jgi:hypothetical protein
MPSKKQPSKKQRLVSLKDRDPKDLEEFIREADEVRTLTNQTGWNILARDLTNYRNQIIDRLVYLDPSKPEFREAKILFVAIDKLFAIVNDYEENRVKAIELMEKLNNPQLAVAMDIDNE